MEPEAPKVWCSNAAASVFANDYDIVHDIFETLRRTEYLRYHRHLCDDLGVKYEGSTSLNEILAVFMKLATTNRSQLNYLANIPKPRSPEL
jgi:hypothetical protein